jgi:Spy/CpxP family protein refolding chaperone
MKRLFIVALLALGLNGFAQEASAWSKKKLDKMTTELSLTEDQQKLLLPLLEEQKVLYDDIKENPDNKDVDRVKIKEVTNKMNAILTPEQKETQKALKAAAK